MWKALSKLATGSCWYALVIVGTKAYLCLLVSRLDVGRLFNGALVREVEEETGVVAPPAAWWLGVIEWTGKS